jgi:hypothetical protein
MFGKKKAPNDLSSPFLKRKRRKEVKEDPNSVVNGRFQCLGANGRFLSLVALGRF